METKRIDATRLRDIVLYEKFNIDWLIRQVNGGNFHIFAGRSRTYTLNLLTDLQKRGYKTIRNTSDGILAE